VELARQGARQQRAALRPAAAPEGWEALQQEAALRQGAQVVPVA